MSLDDMYSLIFSKETIQLSEASHLESSTPIALPANHSYERGWSRLFSKYHERFNSYCDRGCSNVTKNQICGKTEHSSFHYWHKSNLQFTLKLRIIDANLNGFDWLLDSRASAHISYDSSQLLDVTPYKGWEHITIYNK